VPDRFVPPIASHPKRDGREAEQKRQDRQEVGESPPKDCEGTMRVEGSHEMEIVTKGAEQSRAPHVSTFRTAIGCGAKIVAAVGAEAGTTPSATVAEDGEKARRREDAEEQSGEPVWKPDEAAGVERDIMCRNLPVVY
jgi:hypothetical protein